ncbi:MAG: VC1465 family Xer recombination activation factor [Pseudomonadota bacterium]
MLEKHRRRKTKRRPPHYPWVDHEQFLIERKTAGLTQRKAADYLGVSLRTVRNWETGANRIPYPAFKLIRMRAKAIVHVEGWEGWRFDRDGALVTPAGRSFQPWELEQLQLVVSLARRYVEERKTSGRVITLRAVA